jgi:outer membrane protein TolC
LPNRVGSTRYLLSQELPWFGKRTLQRDIALLEAEGATGRAQNAWLELAARIKANYVQLYVAQHNERLIHEILDLMERLGNIQQRYANGLAPQQDAIRAQLEQTAMRNELIAQEGERYRLAARLNTLLARPVNSPLAEPQALRLLPVAAALDAEVLAERVRNRNPLLNAEGSRVRAAEKNRELVYKNRYPDFSVGIAPVQYGNAIREWEVMFEFSIPLQQGTRRAQESEAVAMLYAARDKQEALLNQVLGDLNDNLLAIDTARKTQDRIAHSILPQARLSFDAALAAYSNGKLDFTTLLEAQKQIFQTQQGLLKAEAEAQLRLVDVERLLGEEL